MWRSPKKPQQAASDDVQHEEARKVTRLRWLDIVNLIVSIAILAVVIRAIPLLSQTPEEQTEAELRARVARLESTVQALQSEPAAATAEAVSARLEILPLETDSAEARRGFTGVRVTNVGMGTARNVRAQILLSMVWPQWSSVLSGFSQLTITTTPASLVATISESQEPMQTLTTAGDNAVEVAVESLPPGETLSVLIGPGPNFPAQTCVFSRSGRVQARSPAIAAILADSTYADASQARFTDHLQTQAESNAWVAQFVAGAGCDNCEGSADSAAFALPVLRELWVQQGTPELILEGALTRLEWDATVRAAFYQPQGTISGATCNGGESAVPAAATFNGYPGVLMAYELLGSQ
jgi:hypothetical protein